MEKLELLIDFQFFVCNAQSVYFLYLICIDDEMGNPCQSQSRASVERDMDVLQIP